MIDVLMPQLGESVAEGTVTKWRVREGDIVSREQPLLDVATDKADTEVPAPTAGRIVKVAVAEGAVVPKGALICKSTKRQQQQRNPQNLPLHLHLHRPPLHRLHQQPHLWLLLRPANWPAKKASISPRFKEPENTDAPPTMTYVVLRHLLRPLRLPRLWLRLLLQLRCRTHCSC